MEAIRLSAGTGEDFAGEIKRQTSQDVALCYQCGNCTAGCPYTEFFDYPVNQIMRLIQMGMREAVLSSKAIWLCATCETCTTRCPCEIDVAHIMDSLRAIAFREKQAHGEGDQDLLRVLPVVSEKARPHFRGGHPHALQPCLGTPLHRRGPRSQGYEEGLDPLPAQEHQGQGRGGEDLQEIRREEGHDGGEGVRLLPGLLPRRDRGRLRRVDQARHEEPRRDAHRAPRLELLRLDAGPRRRPRPRGRAGRPQPRDRGAHGRPDPPDALPFLPFRLQEGAARDGAGQGIQRRSERTARHPLQLCGDCQVRPPGDLRGHRHRRR